VLTITVTDFTYPQPFPIVNITKLWVLMMMILFEKTSTIPCMDLIVIYRLRAYIHGCRRIQYGSTPCWISYVIDSRWSFILKVKTKRITSKRLTIRLEKGVPRHKISIVKVIQALKCDLFSLHFFQFRFQFFINII
jgi:hypothetical protein